MIEKVVNGIKYLLNEETLTAQVIQKKGYEGDFIIPEIVVFEKVTYRVTSIGGYAFIGCKSLTSIVIPESVTSIEDYAFIGCKSLTSIVIPESVTSIGERAFWECSSLTSIVIPDSVTSIGEQAFRDCSSLTSITFNGTKAQWKGIELGDDWKDEVPTKVIHCTDGEVKI